MYMIQHPRSCVRYDDCGNVPQIKTCVRRIELMSAILIAGSAERSRATTPRVDSGASADPGKACSNGCLPARVLKEPGVLALRTPICACRSATWLDRAEDSPALWSFETKIVALSESAGIRDAFRVRDAAKSPRRGGTFAWVLSVAPDGATGGIGSAGLTYPYDCGMENASCRMRHAPHPSGPSPCRTNSSAS
jgi:hypothetical protein